MVDQSVIYIVNVIINKNDNIYKIICNRHGKKKCDVENKYNCRSYGDINEIGIE